MQGLKSERHADLLAQTLDELPDVRGNLVHDLHTAVLMREHGMSRVYTRDTGFHRIQVIEFRSRAAAAPL